MSNDDFLISENGHQVPVYGTAPDRPGLYLALFHGRDSRDEHMKDWGFNGPVIGPLEWVHTTYASQMRLMFSCVDDEKRYFSKANSPDAHDFFIDGDMIAYGGKFYGDWSVFYVSERETRKPPDSLESRYGSTCRIGSISNNKRRNRVR